MFCPRCGTESSPESKFCKSCGAPIGGTEAAQSAGAGAPAPSVQAASAPPPIPPSAPPPMPPAAAAPPPPPYAAPQAPPPGMVPMVYQAYPGGPQQVYYVPAPGAHARAGAGVMEGLNAKIRALASTDKLEGFSFKELFKETFMRRGDAAVDDYMMAGSSRTTPPLELVDANWPKPWLFFRVLAGLALAYVAVYCLFVYSQNPLPTPAVMVLGTFAVPLATLTLIWEMNTPRNVSIATVFKLFLLGGGLSIVFATLAYMLPIFSSASYPIAGFVEETSKLLAVVIVMRSTRYPYQLNGILFGATVGAGFACSETMGYGLNALTSVLYQVLPGAANGTPIAPIFDAAMKATVQNLTLRGILSPFGHVVWCGISAGAFWRVKGDKPTSPTMLLDGRFLRAFIIPMALHALWDSPLCTGGTGLVGWHWGVLAIDGAIAWYVMFTMIQQGLHQVRDMQKAQLQHTVAHVEATIGPGMARVQTPVPVPVPIPSSGPMPA